MTAMDLNYCISLVKKYMMVYNKFYAYNAHFKMHAIESDNRVLYIVSAMKVYPEYLSFHSFVETRVGNTPEEALEKWIKWFLNEEISIPEIQMKLAIAGKL